MEAWTALLAALLRAGVRLLEKMDAARAADLRRRIAADGAGVLISQLNPGASDAAGAHEPAKTDPERNARHLDEQL